MTWARAPLRLSFAGGGSDTKEFASRYGGAVVSAAISRYVVVQATIQGPGTAPRFESYPRDETDTAYLKKAADIVGLTRSLWMTSHVDAPPRSGLGASGAIAVAASANLLALTSKTFWPRRAFANEAYLLEEACGTAGGQQDQYAAAFGGINLMRFSKDGVEVGPLKLRSKTILELESSLVLVFLHSRLSSSHSIMTTEIEKVQQGDETVIRALQQQRALAERIADYLQCGDLEAFGRTLGEAWETKKIQSPEASNPIVEAMLKLGLDHGAVAGKLTGAGGGGYLMLYCPGTVGPVVDAYRSIGLRPENVTFDSRGVQTWE